MKQSETKIINRSQINLNPINPKRHTDEQIKQQKKNLKKVGFLGGIVWNENTGNLVDGHRRIQALDLINKYDGTNDYQIKVEMVNFDEKTEKEQLTYMAVGNSKADYNLIAQYVDTIDYENVGLSEDEYNAILNLKIDDVDKIESWEDAFLPVTTLKVEEETNEDFQKRIDEKQKMSKEQVKKEKKHCSNVAQARQEDNDTYIVLNFKDYEQKCAFCDLLGISMSNNMMLNGEIIDELIECMDR